MLVFEIIKNLSELLDRTIIGESFHKVIVFIYYNLHAKSIIIIRPILSNIT